MQREIHHPQEIPLVVAESSSLPSLLEHVGHIQADAAEHFAGVRHLSAPNKIRSPSSIPALLVSAAFLGVAEKLHDGRFPFAALDLDEGESLRAETLRGLRHGLDLALRGAGESLGVDRLDHAARGDGAAEHLELAAAEFLGEIHQFHAEPRVGLVAAEPVHRLRERHARKRRRDFSPRAAFQTRVQQPFDQRVHVLAVMKLISTSICVNSGWRSARRSSSRKHLGDLEIASTPATISICLNCCGDCGSA